MRWESCAPKNPFHWLESVRRSASSSGASTSTATPRPKLRTPLKPSDIGAMRAQTSSNVARIWFSRSAGRAWKSVMCASKTFRSRGKCARRSAFKRSNESASNRRARMSGCMGARHFANRMPHKAAFWTALILPLRFETAPTVKQDNT